MIVEKMLGVAAEAGADLPTCVALGTKVKSRTRSIGVALSYCTLPTEGARSFSLGPNEIELGVGIHGEPGRRKVQFAGADPIAEQLVGAIIGDLANPQSGDALLLVNGFGDTSLIELYAMYNSARRSLEGRGVRVVRSLVGNFVTSLDMVGCSVTVCFLDDDLTRLWDSPVHTAALHWQHDSCRLSNSTRRLGPKVD